MEIESLKIDFSIIIQAFNEKEHLHPFLLSLTEEIAKSNLQGEIIIVGDGSAPEDNKTYSQIAESIKDIPIKMLRHPKNMGKGAAIQTGFSVARGNWIGFVDADGSTTVYEVVRLIKIAISSEELDGVFGSRIRMLGYNIDRRLTRHLSGRIFVTIAHNLFGIPFYDPQCGCKFFRKSKILPFLKSCKEQGYLFDIELIDIGYFNKLKFLEVPISWHDAPGSKVNVIKDGLKMIFGILRIKIRLIKCRR